ncbi:MAG TPA: glycyl-radical enzyme activating protein [Bacteroidales bacterium]|nr:glycyl-radical enzyme activating protein [Bacteroidales bacterium]
MLNVFNIQRYSLHDGNGVRTNIFFKGCPLRCQWCNNPESLEPSPSIMFDERLCRRFGDCIKAGNGEIILNDERLSINRDLIKDVNIFRNICPSKALIVAGQEWSVPDIIREIEKDVPFYKMSEGGVTLTGGEPFAQGAELKDLIIELKKRGIHVSAETSLHLPWELIEPYTDLVDVFLADLKHTDSKNFFSFTGGDATLVMNNFRKLDDTGSSFIVRVPVIPRFNYSLPEMTAIIDFAAGLKNASEINFIPYHDLAREKYMMLGKDYIFGDYSKVGREDMKIFTEYAEERGLTTKIIN